MAAIAAPKISFETLDVFSSSAGGQQDDALSSLRRRLDYITRAFSNNALPERRTKKPRHSYRGLVEEKGLRRKQNVAFWDQSWANSSKCLWRIKMNKFHPYADFFNWPHCARPEQIYF
jgi:hypothetical protein